MVFPVKNTKLKRNNRKLSSPPLFSVLVAQYNNGRFLKQAIESVYGQTYTNWEIIIVDDHSTDISYELYKQYEKDHRIHIYYNNNNNGEGFTKKRCVELSKGEICGFLDPDDVLLPGALQDMVDVHMANRNVSEVLSRMYICDENLNVTGESRKLIFEKGKNYFTNRDYKPEHFVSFKRSFYDQTKGIDPIKRMAADQDMYTKLEEVGKVYVLDKFTLKYRVHKGGLSYGKSMNRTWFWQLIVRYETCVRRGLNIDEYVIEDFLKCLYHREDYLWNIIDELSRHHKKYVHTIELHNMRSPNIIVPLVLKLYPNVRSVVDFGCGLGTWLRAFKEHGSHEILGLDGEWCDKSLLFNNIAETEFKTVDLECPVLLNKTYDLVISLEVAEHLSEISADTFVQSLVNAGKVILFSAAIPGQGGYNHINEQYPEYWQKKFLQHGYVFHDVIRDKIWNNPEVEFWYKQNMFIVAHESIHFPEDSNFKYPVIHPDLLKFKNECQPLIFNQK